MAGDAEVGGNGSMHWRVQHGGNQSIGTDGNVSTTIEVEVIYDSPADAAAAAQNAKANGRTVTLTVNAHNPMTTPAYTFGSNAQVKIRWN